MTEKKATTHTATRSTKTAAHRMGDVTDDLGTLSITNKTGTTVDSWNVTYRCADATAALLPNTDGGIPADGGSVTWPDANNPPPSTPGDVVSLTLRLYSGSGSTRVLLAADTIVVNNETDYIVDADWKVSSLGTTQTFTSSATTAPQTPPPGQAAAKPHAKVAKGHA